MEEETKRFWQKSWHGPRAWLCGVVVMTLAIWPVVFFLGSVPDGLKSYLGTPTVSLIFSTGLVFGVVLIIGFLFWLRHWRNVKRFLFAFACVVTFSALIATEETWRGKRAWMNYRHEQEAQKEKFSIPQLAPPPVPDEQNFALTPLLKPALDFVRTADGIERRDTNAYAHLEQIRADIGEGTTNRLALGDLEMGTLADLEACRNFYRGNTNYPQPVKSGTAAEGILVALGKFDGELTELHQAAATRPFSRFPIEYDYEPAAGILLPHLAHLKGIAELVNVRALAFLGAGQTDRAFADLKLGFRLADSIQNETILVDHLVRVAILDMDLQTVREGLVRQAWSIAQLREIEKYFQSLNLLAELKDAIRGERALEIEWVDYLRRRGSVDADDWVGGWTPVRKIISLSLGGFYYQNMLTIAQLHTQFTLPGIDEKARRIFPETIEAPDKKVAGISDHKWRHPHWFYALWLFPSLSNADLRSARTQTYADAARVACALERYRGANGQFPENLAALAPDFLGKIPDDVVDGQPLRYKKTSAGSYLIYSPGWNNTDDGGTLGWQTEKEKAVNGKNGDWVWFYPASRK